MIKDTRIVYGVEVWEIDLYLRYLLSKTDGDVEEHKMNVIRNLVRQRIEDFFEERKTQYLESAIHALLGLAGENDGYLACAVKHHNGTYGFADDEMFRSVDDLVDWYKTTLPEEIDVK